MKQCGLRMEELGAENLRTARSVETRRRLLLAGMAVFADGGFHGSSVRDIVTRSGHTVNAVSAFYGGKEGLAEAIVRVLKQTLAPIVSEPPAKIASDLAWRRAVKRFVGEVIAMFGAKEEPDCYFAALYRHESARLHAKKLTLHEEIMVPLFARFEKLIALGVEDRDPVQIRLATLSLWNNMIAYALKHRDVLRADVPEGVDPEIFRERTIDYMIEVGLTKLKFKTQRK